MYRIILLPIAFILSLQLKAQVPVNGLPTPTLKQRYISVTADTLKLDSLSIIPNSVNVPGFPNTAYTIDFPNALFYWNQLPPLDSVLIRYRTFPYHLSAVTQNLRFDSIMNFFLGKPYIPDFGTSDRDRFFDFGNITYNGSFGRGISFGNSQDAVVTSNLNLQLNGYLADSIEIAAAITDNNIPIQPDGTTQQLNEFDRIFLQFKKKNWQLSLGDIDIRQNNAYFLSFYKRLQGIVFENSAQLSENINNHSMVSGSVAKGKFTRNIFQGQEGNQGPYRLTGANNEFYFIVLANTERVYLDGELLQRGEDQDYVINYNTAEIAFTPKRMITKDSRIQVEFEYSDRNYLNANLYFSNSTVINNKLTLRVSAFNNNDARNSPINQTLNSDQKDFLSMLGNNAEAAFYPHAVIDTFKNSEILYAKIDTTYGLQTDSIYIYSTHPDSAVYSLSFIEVGQGKGNYIQDLNGANGKVFKWVQPQNGQPQGRFEPAMFLVTPKKQQVLSVGADYQITKATLITTETAFSNYDANTFSDIGNGDNKGFAVKLNLNNQKEFTNQSKLITNAGFEFVEAKFKPLERLRNVEFNREWGLELVEKPADEAIIAASLKYEKKDLNIGYQFSNLRRGADFDGYRNTIVHTQNIAGFSMNNVLQLTGFNTNSEKGYFFKPSFRINKTLTKINNYELSIAYKTEHNEVKNKFSDSIVPRAFSFSIAEAGIKSSPAKNNKWGITYYTRTDAYPLGKELERSDRSSNINLFADLLESNKHQFRVNATYRNLKILNSVVTGLTPEQTLLGRIDYRVNEFKGFLTGQLLYELGSGQEQKRDYTFLEVPAGQGEYTWIDYDNNGIQTLNEFEIAMFQDQASFIKIFTPTNEFIRANYNTFNYSIALNPAVLMNSKKNGLTGFFSRFNFNSSLQINKKERANGLVQLNPFLKPLSDTSLITLGSVFSNTLSFNRLSSKWGIDFNTLKNENKALLTYGYETRENIQSALKLRWNVSRTLLTDISFKKGKNFLLSTHSNFDNRNYTIYSSSLAPGITYTSGTVFRLAAYYEYAEKENRIGSEEKVSSNSITTEIKYNVLQNTSVQSGFTFNNIQFESKTGVPNFNSTSSYIILDGLSPGKNFLWNLDLTKRLSDFLELNIRYEGRKPGENKVIHTGRAAIRALL